MRFNGLRLEIIVAVFAALTVAIFAAQWVVDRYQVERPLLDQAAHVDGVRKAVLAREGTRTNLVVTMGPARDFRVSHRELAGLLEAAYGSDAGRVVVRDSRSVRLTRAFYEMHFALEEGLSTGRFSDMRRATQATAESLKVPAPYLWVENGRVYVALRDGGSVLYEVIEHAPGQAGKSQEEGGRPVG